MKNREVTVYGYPADELIEFARTCRACGLEPGEIKNFGDAVRKVFVFIKQQTEREIEEALKRAVDDAWRSGSLFKEEG